MFYVYILRSLKDTKKYIGMTEDLEKRLIEYNNGNVKSTRYRRPLVLLHKESFQTKAEAMAREKFFKSGKGREYMKDVLHL